MRFGDDRNKTYPHRTSNVGPFVGSQGSVGNLNTKGDSEDAGRVKTLPRISTTLPLGVSASSIDQSRQLSGRESLWSSVSDSSPKKASTSIKRRRSALTRQPEWSLFGQLMENEGQLLRTSTAEDGRKQISRHVSASVGTQAEYVDGGDRSVVQSPVQERSMSNSEGPQVHPPELETSDYDSDQSVDSKPFVHHTPPVAGVARSRWTIPTIPALYRNILKCAVAYLIGSLFTFVPSLSNLIADISTNRSGQQLPSPSGHMVATVVVYFNPAKTAGAMAEADLFCLFGVAWSAFVSLGSMSTYWWLEVKPGWEWLADVLALFWIGLAMSAVAWMKVWMAKASFNTACSMAAIIIFVVVIKEGGMKTLQQVTFIVFVGIVVTNIVCHVLWPASAAANLQDDMSKTLGSYSTLLAMLTDTFLLGDSSTLHQPSQGKLQRAIESHQSSFISLKKNLTEARSEWFWPWSNGGRKSVVSAYEDAVDSLNRLAQHLNGLRSGTRLQYELTKAHRDGKIVLWNPGVDLRTQKTLSRNLEREEVGKGKAVNHGDDDVDSEKNAMLQAAAAIFGDLVEELGPPLNALSKTCTDTLKHLRETVLQSNRPSSQNRLERQEFSELSEEIERALFTFESTSNHALIRIYRRNDIVSATNSFASMSDFSAENTLLTRSGDNETLFLVYFFIFTLQEFAHELISLVDAVSRIYCIESPAIGRGRRWIGHMSLIFRVLKRKANQPGRSSKAQEGTTRPNLKKRLSTYLTPTPRHRAPSFPKVQPHAPNTMQTPSWDALSFGGKAKQSLWTVGTTLKQRNVKYAFKAGMATAILAAPAFFDTTRPVFLEYRGEWALISFFVVISPTIGATNFLSLHRVLGTLFGAATAVIILSIFPNNPTALSIFGFLYSIPCFYYIVGKPLYATTGRFVLLTYNLTCLYSYNLRQKDKSVIDIAYHRSTAVIVGVVWAGLVSRLWWPSEARRELGNALSEFCLNIGWLYTRLVATNFGGTAAPSAADYGNITHWTNRSTEDNGHTENSSLLPKSVRVQVNDSIRTFMSMELHLQIKLLELQNLLAQAQHEPRLKGPFPVKLYRSILTSLQAILDKLHSMRCVTTREEWFTTVKRDFILPVTKERREMAGNVVLYFSVLSSAFKLKAPLPPYLPPAEKSRQRLADAIKRLEVVKDRDVKGSRQLLFFAYVLMMKGVIQELDYLGLTLQDAFGVIGKSREEFESLFTTDIGNAGEVV